MRQRMNWDDPRLVLAVSRAGSLSAAARTLGIDHSTLHRKLGAIEARLGVRLFERSRTGYSLTPAGEALVELAGRVEDEISAVETQLAGEDMRPAGTVRIAVSDTILCAMMGPALARFADAYPGITLEVTTSSLSVSLTKREADVAIRVTDRPDDHLIGRRLGQIAARPYHAAAGPNEGRGLERWIGFEDSLRHLGPAKWMDEHVPPEAVVYRCDTLLGIADAAQAGVGLAILPDVLARKYPMLAPADQTPVQPISLDMWILTHPSLRKTARVRAVMDVIGREVEQSLALEAATALA